MTTTYPKKKNYKRKEKKYRKATNEMGRWFPGGMNRLRDLSLIFDDDDDDEYQRLRFFNRLYRSFISIKESSAGQVISKSECHGCYSTNGN